MMTSFTLNQKSEQTILAESQNDIKELLRDEGCQVLTELPPQRPKVTFADQNNTTGGVAVALAKQQYPWQGDGTYGGAAKLPVTATTTTVPKNVAFAVFSARVFGSCGTEEPIPYFHEDINVDVRQLSSDPTKGTLQQVAQDRVAFQYHNSAPNFLEIPREHVNVFARFPTQWAVEQHKSYSRHQSQVGQT
ncbi:hypothetical protein VTH82DRAFT_6045 [Thermothelomyces myriococcoides]